MIDCGNLHASLQKTNAVRLKRHRQEVKVRGVAQQILMRAEIRRHRAVGADPYLAGRLRYVALHRVMELNRADLQRLLAEKLLFYLRRQKVRQRTGNVRL